MNPFIALSPMLSLLILGLGLALVVGFIYLLRDEPNEETMNPPSNKAAIIKTVYFYLVSLIGLLMVVFSVADLVNLGLKTWVFPKADLNEYKQPSCAMTIYKDPGLKETDEQYQMRLKSCEDTQVSEEEARAIRNQRDAVRDISFFVVGLPLFLYHWITVRKDQKKDREAKA